MSSAIFRASPPRGINVSKPQWVVECAVPAQMWSEIRVAFEGIAINLLASWIFEILKKCVKTPGNRCCINHKEITLQSSNIVVIINDQLASEKAREAQYAEAHQNPKEKLRRAPLAKPTTERKKRRIKKQ